MGNRDSLLHFGIKRRSGRYPWGSGKNPEQRGESLLGSVKKLEDEGLSESEIANGLGISTSKIRRLRSIAKDRKRIADQNMAMTLKDKGMSNVAIGERMGGINESSVRSLLDPITQERALKTMGTVNLLRNHISEHGPVDVGLGVEARLGISRTKLDTAIEVLTEFEGYEVHTPKISQQTAAGNKTQMLILAKPGTDIKQVMAALPDMKPLGSFSEDGGRTYIPRLKPIESVTRDRIHIRYADDTPSGKDKDGVIELRSNVKDLSLEGKRYAQVRVGVNGTHYMKGMAIYGDNIPDGVDIVYNTNKKRGTPDEKVFKPMKFDDPENPFGSMIERQISYVDKDGKQRVSPLNIVNEEGTWDTWSRSISSQVLSKQKPDLAKQQLGEAYGIRHDEYDEIMQLTNPAVKKRLLDSFADDADSAAVHLKAASLPRQAVKVLLPIPSLSEKEVYAPGFREGERVVLIRHPHGGIFEIPELLVTTKNPEARRILGDARDAIGINSKVAEQLSGADFDGDTVLVIPNKNNYIRTSPPLKGLKDFDPKEKYKQHEGMTLMDKKRTQLEMGNISNLITDMTIKGASFEELERAVKHSMVVIDAEKHKLDYKQSALDNGISALKKKYQTRSDGGASTLISRSSSQARVPYRKDRGMSTTTRNTDPLTGKKIFENYSDYDATYIRTKKKVKNPVTGLVEYVDVKPKLVRRQTLTTKMAKEEDATVLISDFNTTIERVYAQHANKLKALANQARKSALEVQFTEYSKSAREVYSKEVEALTAKLEAAYRNKPLERQAQILAATAFKKKTADRYDLEPDDLKKLKSRELIKARIQVGADPHKVDITDAEWTAIQAGAVTRNLLENILKNTDLTAIRQRAMPRTFTAMSPAKVTRARTMADQGRTRSEIADILGVSISSLDGIVD